MAIQSSIFFFIGIYLLYNYSPTIPPYKYRARQCVYMSTIWRTVKRTVSTVVSFFTSLIDIIEVKLLLYEYINSENDNVFFLKKNVFINICLEKEKDSSVVNQQDVFLIKWSVQFSYSCYNMFQRNHLCIHLNIRRPHDRKVCCFPVSTVRYSFLYRHVQNVQTDTLRKKNHTPHQSQTK